jgi:hypothetical protein
MKIMRVAGVVIADVVAAAIVFREKSFGPFQ